MQRKTVLLPGEVESTERYKYSEGLDAREPKNHTLFREAERYYKSAESDADGITEFSCMDRRTSSPKVNSYLERLSEATEYFQTESGFIMIPNLLTVNEQEKIVEDILKEYLKFPSNLNIYVPLGFNVFTTETTVQYKKKEMTSKDILFKLRWITLGQSYNWTTKQYDENQYEFPALISKISQEVAQVFCQWTDFRAEAGIVNRYGFKDSLTGHVDRSEENMDAPLISLSIGRSAVFLIGENRDVKPDAFILNSGDVCIMSGKSRQYLHGVPKILTKVESPCFSDPTLNDFIKDSRINVNVRQIH